MILYCVGQFKMNEMVFRWGEAIIFDHIGENTLNMRVDLTHHLPERLEAWRKYYF